jgi:hypothetical protein
MGVLQQFHTSLGKKREALRRDTVAWLKFKYLSAFNCLKLVSSMFPAQMRKMGACSKDKNTEQRINTDVRLTILAS